MSGRHVDPRYARSDEYRQELEEIERAGVCPFCPEDLRWHPKPVLHRAGSWMITRIRQNYINAAEHFLLLGDRHIERLTEMNADDWAALAELLRWATAEFGLVGGALCSRFGQTNYTGATVVHLHFHLIIPEIDPESNQAKTVNFPIG